MKKCKRNERIIIMKNATAIKSNTSVDLNIIECEVLNESMIAIKVKLGKLQTLEIKGDIK